MLNIVYSTLNNIIDRLRVHPRVLDVRTYHELQYEKFRDFDKIVNPLTPPTSNIYLNTTLDTSQEMYEHM